jgi:hypothetical protein
LGCFRVGGEDARGERAVGRPSGSIRERSKGAEPFNGQRRRWLAETLLVNDSDSFLFFIRNSDIASPLEGEVDAKRRVGGTGAAFSVRPEWRHQYPPPGNASVADLPLKGGGDTFRICEKKRPNGEALTRPASRIRVRLAPPGREMTLPLSLLNSRCLIGAVAARTRDARRRYLAR